MIFYVILLVFGVFACSTAAIWIKQSAMHPVLLAGVRQLIAAALLLPIFLRQWKQHRAVYTGRHLLRTILPGALLGVHFVTWIIGIRLAQTANGSLIVNMVPIVMPFLLVWLMDERLTRGEGIGTAVALAGVSILFVADYHLDWEHFQGDLLCFGSMLLFAGYLALGRRNRDFPAIWLYLVPLYFWGGLICVAAWPVSLATGIAAPAPLGAEARFSLDPTLWDWLMALGLGVVPTIMGHSVLNFSMKHLRGQMVSIANLGQFIFAGILAYFLLSEVPAWTFYPAAAFMVTGAVIALRATPPPAGPLQQDASAGETRTP
ncbi:MAG: DMT family transporter [Phycisphaerae bacterium]